MLALRIQRSLHMTRYLVLAAAMLLAACGGRDTVASKSAAAYREAPAKGAEAGGGAHDGHEAAVTQSASPAPMDHSAHGGTAADAHAGHDMLTATHTAHASMKHDTTHATAMDHSAMGHTTAVATDHSAHGAAAHSQPAMDHAQHMTTPPPAPILPTVPRSNAEMQTVNPSSTLQSDAFDAPSPVSVSEAAKAQHDAHQSHERKP